jgi:hypothetical protein
MRESLRWKETIKGKKTTEVDSEQCAPGNRRKCARFHRRYQVRGFRLLHPRSIGPANVRLPLTWREICVGG